MKHITLPTRVTNQSATLIDNIFSTELYNNKSAIIVNNISDHQMICTYSTNTISTSSKKFIEIEKKDQQALDNFLNQLGNSNIVSLLNLDEDADPNQNFNKFMEHFMQLKQECLKKKLVRFNRKKT